MTAAVNETRFIVIFIFSGTFSAPRWWACWCWLPLYYIWIDKNIIHLSSFITIKRFSEIRNSKQAFKGVTVGQSDNCTGPSLTYIKINVPQSNITWPNKSNIVTVTVFGNLYEEKKYYSCTWRSLCPPANSEKPWKTASVTGKSFNSSSVCDENKSLRPSVLPTGTSVNFPPENSLHPASEGVRQFTDGDYAIM